jgi:FkbM family methyltransferase
MDPNQLEKLIPHMLSEEERVQMGTRCRDMDGIPRVSEAGKVQTMPDQTRVQVMHNGIRVLADGYYGQWMTRLIELCGGVHEPQEERVFYEVMPRLPYGTDATMIELGGFWSYYSLWFLASGKNRRAIVVEPDPKHLAVGRTNAQLNQLNPVFISGFVSGTSFPYLVPFNTEESGKVNLRRFTVVQLMEIHKLSQLNVLHLDIQGAEFDVLTSCQDLLKAGQIQFLFVSTHDFRVSGDPLTHQRCLAVVRNAGGRVIAEHDVGESYSGDGLIVAYFGGDKDAGEPVTISRNRYSESLLRNPLYDLSEAFNRSVGKFVRK